MMRPAFRELHRVNFSSGQKAEIFRSHQSRTTKGLASVLGRLAGQTGITTFGAATSTRSQSSRRFLHTTSRPLYQAATYFAETHEWLKVEDDKRTVTIGVSDFAQKELGKIVYVDMPDPPHFVPANESVAAIECGDGKAVGEVYTPQECEVEAVNSELVDEPSIINEDCYGKGWIVKGKFAEDFVQGKLMDEAAYLKFLETCETQH